MELRTEKGNMKQNDINITTDMIKEQVKKMPNLKSPGPERVTVLLAKKINDERIAKQMDNIIIN